MLLTTLVNVRSTTSRSKYIIADVDVAGKRTEKQTAGRSHRFQMHCLPALTVARTVRSTIRAT